MVNQGADVFAYIISFGVIGWRSFPVFLALPLFAFEAFA